MHAATLRLPWQRARRGSPWTSAAILLVLPVATGLIGARIGLPAATLAGLMLLGALVTLWYLQVDGWLNQNLPLLARQLPGQLRVLRLQLLGGALAMALLAAAVLAGFTARPLPQWLPATALVVLLLAWLARFPWLWALVWVPILGLKPLERALQGALAVETAPGWALGLLLAGLWPVMGAGGRLHRWAATGAQRWRSAMLAQQKGEPVPATARSPLWDRIGRLFAWPMHAWRAALLRRAAPANALARLEVALMGSSHWTVMLWAALLVVTLIAGVLGLVQLRIGSAIGWRELAQNLGGLAIGLSGIAVSVITNLALCLRRTRREQALLVLLPGLPAGPALGAALRRRWLLQALIGLALAAALVAVAMALSRPGMARMLGGYLALLSFAPALVLQDWSKLDGSRSHLLALLMILALAVAAASAWAPWPSGLTPLLAAPGAIGLLAWRWRATRDLPAQLPAGRALQSGSSVK